MFGLLFFRALMMKTHQLPIAAFTSAFHSMGVGIFIPIQLLLIRDIGILSSVRLSVGPSPPNICVDWDLDCLQTACYVGWNLTLYYVSRAESENAH